LSQVVADVWSLGIMLYVLATGAHPVNSLGLAPTAKHFEWISRLQEWGGNVCWPANPHTSDNLRSFISAMLTKDPVKRPVASALVGHPALALVDVAAPLSIAVG
jgi:serine/threonine protein kinase